MRLYGSICLSDIPEECIRTSEKNGKKYLNIEVNDRREPSQYGHTHYIKASVKAADRKDGVNYFIGDLKPSMYNDQPIEGAAMPPAQMENAKVGQMVDLFAKQQMKVKPVQQADDLPF